MLIEKLEWMKNSILFLLFFILITFSISCAKEGQKENEVSKEEDTTIIKNTLKIPPLLKLDAKVLPEVASWSTFKGLETEIKKLYDYKNDEDFSFIIDELITKEKELSVTDFPEKFNTPSVKSRVLVLKTYILQTKASIDDKESTAIIMKQKEKVIIAYNGLLKQFNEQLEENLADEFLNKIKP